LVFAYEHGAQGNATKGGTYGGHHEKFVNSPLIIDQGEEKNLKELTNEGTKEYFLRNLAQFQKGDNALDQTAERINNFIKANLGEEDSHEITVEQVILHLLDPKGTPLKRGDEGKNNRINIELETSFQFGYFADCINESILM